MKLNWNKKYTTIAAYSLIVIVIAVLFVVFVFRFKSFSEGFSFIGSVLSPIICGLVIAYAINPLVGFFETRLFKKLKEGEPSKEGIVLKQLHKTPVGSTMVVKELEKRSADLEKKRRSRRTAARVLSIVLAYIVILAAITGIAVAVVPNVSASVIDLVDKLPGYIDNLEAFLTKTFVDNPTISKYISDEFSDLDDLMTQIMDYIKPMTSGLLGDVSSGLWTAVSAVFTGTKNVLLGLVIAIYLLFSKERLLAQIKKTCYALFKNEGCERFFSTCSKSNKIFTNYIISNLLDALIIFAAMAVGCVIMGMPYPLLIAVVCGVTNLIPFFGPFIGAIPCGFLILLVDPIKVIWFALFVLVLQQIDGNLIKPFLFGGTTGLPAVWVLISIIVGGGLFGVVGMILGVPVFAVFYLLFAEFVSGRLKKKDLPYETDDYTISTEEFIEKYVSGAVPAQSLRSEEISAPPSSSRSDNTPSKKSRGAR